MKFAIQVNEGPYNHEASVSALNFVRAAVDAGHEIFRVFFYHDGVNNGTRYTTPPQDDINIINACRIWLKSTTWTWWFVLLPHSVAG